LLEDEDTIFIKPCSGVARMKKVGKIETHFMFINFFFLKSRRLWEVEKILYSLTGHR
jgi:hypothetical protein